jgi:hypothetical protein
MIEFLDRERRRWQASVVSHGRTSDYLNPRVHRPVVQFSCLDRILPHRYVGYPQGELGPLEERSEEELRELLEKASSH